MEAPPIGPLDSQSATMDRGAWVRWTLARVAFLTAIAAAIAMPAAAQGRAVGESAVRTLETQALGPAHALEHAIERRVEHRALRRWRSLSRAGRARLIGARRLALHAASTAPASEVGSWDSPFPLPVHAIHAAVLTTGKVMIWSYPFQATA